MVVVDSCVCLRDHAFDHALSFCRRSSTAVRVRRSAVQLHRVKFPSDHCVGASNLRSRPSSRRSNRPSPLARRSTCLTSYHHALLSHLKHPARLKPITQLLEKSSRASRVLPSAADPADQRLLLDIRWHAQRPSRLTFSWGHHARRARSNGSSTQGPSPLSGSSFSPHNYSLPLSVLAPSHQCSRFAEKFAASSLV